MYTFLFFALSLQNTGYSKGCECAEREVVPKGPWTHQLSAGFYVNQAKTSSNWHTGSSDMWSWLTRVDAKTQFENNEYIWFWMADLEYGKSKSNKNPMIKFSDKIFTETVGSKKLAYDMNTYTGLKFESQFDSGIGEYINKDGKKIVNTKVSHFLNPGYVTHSIGFGYNPSDLFGQRVGYATKLTVATAHKRRFADDIETSRIETIRWEPGIESISEFNYTFHEMANFKSTFRLFYNFEGVIETDLSWNNTLTASVTSYLEMSLAYALLYDIDLDSSYQRNQALSLGLTWNLF